MPAGTSTGPNDALTAARFSLTIDGVEIAQFSELVAITTEADPPDLATQLIRKLPGKRVPPTVTLRRGMTRGLELAAWHDAAIEGRGTEARRNASLTAYDTAGQAVAKYYLENAWPSKVEISALTAGASDVLMETVTFAAERAKRAEP
jgi:phage tail-like protein